MNSPVEVAVIQKGNFLGWVAIACGAAGGIIYGISLRVVPKYARQAALEGSNPYAAQTLFWISLLVIFSLTMTFGLLTRKNAERCFLGGIGVGMGVMGILVITVNYLSFYFFR